MKGNRRQTSPEKAGSQSKGDDGRQLNIKKLKRHRKKGHPKVGKRSAKRYTRDEVLCLIMWHDRIAREIDTRRGKPWRKASLEKAAVELNMSRQCLHKFLRGEQIVLAPERRPMAIQMVARWRLEDEMHESADSTEKAMGELPCLDAGELRRQWGGGNLTCDPGF